MRSYTFQTHGKSGTPFLAVVVAASTVLLVGHQFHTLTLATDLKILACLPTLPAVERVCRHIHTPLHAAVWPPAALGTANPRMCVTCQDVPVEVQSKEAAA